MNPQWNSNWLKISKYRMLCHFFHEGCSILKIYTGSFIKAKDTIWPNQRAWEKLNSESNIKWLRFAGPGFLSRILSRMLNSYLGKHTISRPQSQTLTWSLCLGSVLLDKWRRIGWTLLNLPLSFRSILETSTEWDDLLVRLL